MRYADPARLVALAARVEPEPLIAPQFAPAPYPVEALGATLAPFVHAVVEATQCAEATAAQSALAVAALVVQAHADVRTPYGLNRPTSLFFLTVATSGERKSAADGYALTPIHNAEADAREPYRRAYGSWRNEHDAWGAMRVAIKRRKGDREKKEADLAELGDEPLQPLRPERLLADLTYEGLVKNWTYLHGSLGAFTDEAAKWIAGHSMTPEARLRTAGAMSNLWDGVPVDRVRAGDGFLALRARRLSFHLLGQPGVATRFLAAEDLNDQGLVARFLVAEAPEKAGTRMFRWPPPLTDPRLVRFNEAAGSLLARPARTLDGRNELDPRVLVFSPGAEKAWIDLHDQIESRLGAGGELVHVKAFGSKLAENAARMAAVLEDFDNPQAEAISGETIARVVDLASYYASEAERLARRAKLDRHLLEAERLRAWLVNDWPEELISLRAIQQYAPTLALRERARAERSVDTLLDHGWLAPNGPGVVKGEKARETFIICRANVPA